MPFDAAPERGDGDDDFTFTLSADLAPGHRCMVTFTNSDLRIVFMAPTDMPSGTECSVKRIPDAAGFRMLSYRLDGIAAEFIVIAQVVRP